MIIDIMRLQQSFPSIAQSIMIDLQDVSFARESAYPRVSWPLLFIKAAALTFRDEPCMRQCLFSWPWLHLYEDPFSVGTVAVSRQYNDENWLFFARFPRPESYSLSHLQSMLINYTQSPVEQVFRDQLRLARRPAWIRRIFWWLRMELSGPKRVKRLGTFGLTTVGSQGVTIIQPRAPVPVILSYGPMGEEKKCNLTIVYDHRIVDGAQVATILQRISNALRGAITQELLSMVPKCNQRSRAA